MQLKLPEVVTAYSSRGQCNLVPLYNLGQIVQIKTGLLLCC